MLESDQEIIVRLTERLATLVPLAFGNGFKLSATPPERYYRRYSFVFRYWMVDPKGEQRPLFVKIPLPSEIRTLHEAIRFERVRSEIKNEFEIMRTIAQVISKWDHAGLFAIQPGICVPEFNAIVLEEIELEMLKNHLMSWGILFGKPKNWDYFERELNLAGEWLKIIHSEFHRERFATPIDLGLEDFLNFKLESLESLLGYRLAGERKLFFQAFSRNKSLQIPVSSLHHDFHLGNIFVTRDGRVGALDPNWKESGAIFEDLASVLIDPLTRKAQVASLGLMFRSSAKDRYERAILQGYYGKRFTPPSMLYFYCALASLEKWRANEELMKNIKLRPLALAGSIFSKFTRFYFSRLVKTFLNRELEISPVN